jgi:hypothetical protein
MTTEQVLDKVSTSSSPSDLRITDLKVAVVGSDGFGYGWPLIKKGQRYSLSLFRFRRYWHFRRPEPSSSHGLWFRRKPHTLRFVLG